MNYLYVGKSADLNVGNGKSVSAVGAVLKSRSDSLQRGQDKTIFSNIKLQNIEFQEFRPKDMGEVLDTKDAIVLFDELHTIVHKNHKVHEGCGKHAIKGLCYLISEFLRQVRKRGIDTHSTSQTEGDVQFQMWQMMNVRIQCEKYHLDKFNSLRKCIPRYPDALECPKDHRHYILQKITPAVIGYNEILFDPEPFYENYDTYEIVLPEWRAHD